MREIFVAKIIKRICLGFGCILVLLIAFVVISAKLNHRSVAYQLGSFVGRIEKSNKKINAESDFEFELNGKGELIITNYVGKNKEVQIPSKIQKKPVIGIGEGAFYEKELVSVTIPNSVTSIGDGAFTSNKLTNVIISNSVVTIGEEAFYNNKLTKVTIPNSVTTIGEAAFGDNELTSITIPNSVTSIGKGAFEENKLTSVTIPNSITSIGNWAFSDNNITRITIGSNVNLDQSFDIDNNFPDFYNVNGREAGTYTFTNGTWSKE